MRPSTIERLPQNGPLVMTVPGVTDVAVGANTVGPSVRFTWPRSYVVDGFFVCTRNPTAVELANTKLRLTDETPDDLQLDGYGLAIRMNLLAIIGRVAPILPTTGIQFRWFAFRRLVKAGETWLVQIENQNAAEITPWLGFRLAERVPVRPR